MNSTKLFLILALSVAGTFAAYRDTNKDCAKKESNSTTTYIRVGGDNCKCDGPGKMGFPRDTAQCESSTTAATTTAKTTASTTTTTESPNYNEKNNDCNKGNQGKTYTKPNGDTCTCTQFKGSVITTYNNGNCKRATTTTTTTTAATTETTVTTATSATTPTTESTTASS